MYKEVSYKYEQNISKNVAKVLNIYFDDVLVDPIYIIEFKKGGTLFDKDFELGSMPSQYVELKIHKKANLPIPKQIRVEFGVLVNNALTLYEVNQMLLGELNVTPLRSFVGHDDSFEMIPIGTYNVDDYSEKDSNIISIRAYDNIIKLEADDGYYDASELIRKNGYATLGEIAEDICKKKGLELGPKSFLNSDTKIYVYDDSITARQYMGYIAECAGCFVCAGRDGKIYFKSIGEDTIEISQNMFKTYKYGEEYNLSRIAYENGKESFKFGNETGNTLWLDPDNLFLVEEAQVQNIYNKMKDFELCGFEGTVIIDPRVDIGDIIKIDGKRIVYQGEMTFGGVPRANIKSRISIKAKSETTIRRPSQKTINRRVQSRIDEAEGKITQLVEETSEYSQTLTKHEQTLNSISSKVQNIEEFSREITSMNELHLSDTAKAKNLVLTLKIYGDTQKFKVLTPSETLVPSETLALYGDTFDLVIDTQSRANPSENAIIHTIPMIEPLRNNDNIRDELNIINGKVTIIRRIDNDGSILANEVIEKYEDINLETFDKDTYIYIREYPNVEYFCRYVIKNDYLDTFATQQELQNATVELNSLIEQKQAEITLLVSRKVGKDEVISSINMTPEEVKILADKIKLEGYTTINDGFKIDENGNMEAVNGKFTGGEFYLYSEDNYPSITVSKQLMQYQTSYSSIYPDSIVVSAGNGKGTTIGMSAGETDNAQLYVLGAGGGTWVHHDKINCMGDIHAYAYKYDSKVELKENIRKIEIDALKLINETDIYEFDYKGNLRNKTIGLIIGEGYRTPKEVISEENSINSYSMNSISWKAIQELDQKLENLLNILKKIPILGRIITKRWKK